MHKKKRKKDIFFSCWIPSFRGITCFDILFSFLLPIGAGAENKNPPAMPEGFNYPYPYPLI